MALFSMSGVLRGFPSAEYHLYASTKTLVRPCSSKKLLIYELETYAPPNTSPVIYACVRVCVEKEQGPDRSSPRAEESANRVGIVQTTGAGLSLRPLLREFEPV